MASLIVALLGACLGSAQLAPPKVLTFAQFEQKKYEAFNALKTFQGRYRIVTAKGDGTGLTEELIYQYGPNGKQMLIIVNGKATIETGWTSTLFWRVNYPDHNYSVKTLTEGLTPKPYAAPKSNPDELSFVAGESGILFGYSPEPKLEAPIREKLADIETDRYIWTSTDEAKDAKVLVTQWCDAGKFLVRKFEVKITAKGEQQALVRGILVDDDEKAIIPPKVGSLPDDKLVGFTRLGS